MAKVLGRPWQGPAPGKDLEEGNPEFVFFPGICQLAWSKPRAPMQMVSGSFGSLGFKVSRRDVSNCKQDFYYCRSKRSAIRAETHSKAKQKAYEVFDICY